MTRNLGGGQFASSGLAAAILESTHALVITLDPEGRITGFNRACELLTGYEADEIIGTPIWQSLLPEEAIAPIQGYFAALKEAGDLPEEYENEWVTKDGRRPVIAWSNSILRNATGEIELVISVGVDISEKKAYSERLARAQRIAKIGGWEWTVATDEQQWSDQLFLNLGLEPGSIVPTTEAFYARVHPDDLAAVQQRMEGALDAHQPYSADFRVIWPDGTTRIVHEEAEVVLEADGEVAVVAGTLQDVTELRETENRLKQITQSYATAQRIAKIGNWNWNANTGNEWWSDEIYKIFGLEPGAIEPSVDSFLARVHPDDREKLARAIDAAQTSLTSYDLNLRIFRSDAAERIVRETGVCILDANGALVGLAGTTQDITEKSTAEQALADAARRLEAATRLARLGNWEWDPDSNRLSMSEETLTICGLAPDYAVVDNAFLMAMIPQEEHAEVLEKMNRAVYEGETYTHEYHIVRPNGDRRAVIEHGEAYRDEDTGKVKLIGTIQDITERKRMQQALQDSEAQLRAIFDNAPVGIGIADLRGHLMEVNQVHADFLGYTKEEMVGLTYLDFTHPDHMDRTAEQVGALLAGDVSNIATEKQYIRSDGTVAWGARTASLVHDDTGEPKFVVLAVEDIDARKKTERELATATGRLREAQRIAHIGHWEWHAGRAETLWSDEMFLILGVEAESFRTTQDSFFEMVHPNDRQPLLALMARALNTGTPYETEFRIYRRDGALRHIYEKAERYFDEDSGTPSVRGVIQDITERKETELALRELAERLEEAQRIAHVGHWEWDPHTNHSIWSAENYRIFGLSPDAEPSPNHSAFLLLVHPDDRDKLQTTMEKTLETGRPYDIEFRIIRPDGAVRTIFERGERYRPTESEHYRIRGVLQDVTERKEAEDKLRETMENLEESQRVGKVGSWVWDIEKDREWWSDEIYRIYGIEVGATPMQGYEFLNFVHPADRHRVRTLLDESLETGAPYIAEYRIHRADGREAILSERGQAELDSQGKAVFLRGIAQDVTETRAAEVAMRILKNRLEEAQQLAQLGSWTWEPANDEVWWSDEKYRIFGLAPGSVELKGHDFLRYVHPEDRLEVEAISRASAATKHPYTLEYRIVRPDGSERMIFEQCEWGFDESVGRPKWRGVVQDVTVRKRAELELARLNAELEQRVEERTAELRAAQEELVKNERLATLGQLTATVSHELRNPLGAMRTSMYVIEKKAEAREGGMEPAIQRVNRNITRCDQIIDELLDYTRIRDLDLQAHEIDGWLDALLNEQTIPDEVGVVRRFRARGLALAIDSDRLRRAFINIFENAMQAADSVQEDDRKSDAPHVWVETRLREDRLEIAVSDNGPGVPAEIREKIFEPLFSTKNFGVGLGLPTVRQIMNQHGGGVEVSARRGGGAIFALWLPRELERGKTKS